MMTEAHRNM